MTKMMYFDNAATTPMSLEALQTYEKTAQDFIGNPSALHREGLKAQALLQENRETIAALLGVNASNLVFTSGATESNSIVLNNLIWTQKPGQVILTNIEHPSITEFARLLRQIGWNVTFLNAPKGFVRPEDLKAALTDLTRLVCCMLVNNVVGSIQNIAELVAVVREFQAHKGRKIHFHTDAVQALGKIPFSLTGLGVDSASFSAHKFNGPRGIGILYNTNSGLQSLSRGGEQENGLRPGTENLPAIAAMTKALQIAYGSMEEHLRKAREINAMLRTELSEFSFLSAQQGCSPYILNLSVNPLPSEVFARILYDKGFCISSGSACSNNARQKGESVLSSMLIRPDDARSSIRLSFGFDTEIQDARELAEAIKKTYREHV
ncbi:cysteine desulfurase family protein [Sphaerochaeta pleomorpha str. Grapes]|uniref:Cysteine desulfurase family protein n=1 Tax=Sphaerochaeta pleomorpha (strain ATCC BAA-1885 / DSM 22778 / Grapes) TaxID=158190 RepID=G8QWN8_SPHPG|nr:cysteine desulfurase family protein [Sphaerochaeta pleomorpha]AEV28332.1 cysteine desulfurase family protein [Sphaerochaeta pleomorpha str. Grapes]